MALATLATACASSQDKTAQGSFAVQIGASRSGAQFQGAKTLSDDPLSRLGAATITISELEARKSGGVWVPVEGGFPKVVDVLALARNGGIVSLPADLLPEGQYNALQARITQVQPTPLDGHRVSIATPGSGWSVIIPVDFGVVPDQSTLVDLNIRLDRSLRLVNDVFEFDPEIEVEGVEHD
jgi:hypothetical protein